LCYAKLFVKYKTASADDKPIDCQNESDLNDKIDEIKKRFEATQIDVFVHNPHASLALVQEWRSRAAVVKQEEKT